MIICYTAFLKYPDPSSRHAIHSSRIPSSPPLFHFYTSAHPASKPPASAPTTSGRIAYAAAVDCSAGAALVVAGPLCDVEGEEEGEGEGEGSDAGADADGVDTGVEEDGDLECDFVQELDVKEGWSGPSVASVVPGAP
jgi:hypothetical protein